MSIHEQQFHGRFRIFEGNSIPQLAQRILMFTAGGAIAVKSMGIEHLPADDKIIISLGYADTQKGYPVKIHERVFGQLPTDDEFDAIDLEIDKAAAEFGNVICHDIFVDAERNLHVVFMESPFFG